jgi:NADH-quinone oxidoreductase subunit J
MGQGIAFWVLAIVAVAAALAVVGLRSVFRSALGLILCFLAVAGIFITLNADFLGAVQVLIYVGAVAVLIILAIMLTREVEHANVSNKLRLPALAVSVLFLGISAWAALSTQWPQTKDLPTEPTATILGNLLFGQNGFVLIVEIAALVILATIIGAISITREK